LGMPTIWTVARELAPEEFSISMGAGAADIKRHFCWFATTYEEF